MVCQSGLLKRKLTIIVRNLGQSYSLSYFRRKMSGLLDYIILKKFFRTVVAVYIRDKYFQINSYKYSPVYRDCNHFLLEDVYG